MILDTGFGIVLVTFFLISDISSSEFSMKIVNFLIFKNVLTINIVDISKSKNDVDIPKNIKSIAYTPVAYNTSMPFGLYFAKPNTTILPIIPPAELAPDNKPTAVAPLLYNLSAKTGRICL